MTRRLFFDCDDCRNGEHNKCIHGSHSLGECKCIDDITYEILNEEKDKGK